LLAAHAPDIERTDRARKAARRRKDALMQMRTRKALGTFGLLVYLALYAAGAATIGSALIPILPAWAELVFYAVAGIIWIFPLRPLFRWMTRADSSASGSRN
jgi:hypothetical protein